MAENPSTQELGGVRGSSDFKREIDVTLWLMLLFSSLYDPVFFLISRFRIAQGPANLFKFSLTCHDSSLK